MQTFIFGHRNPDTDSICSSIALSYLKNALGYKTVAKAPGHLNNETKFVLKYFNINEPQYLNDVKVRIKNIKFTDEFISKSNKEYLNYLNEILNNNEIGIKYKEQINKQELEKLEQDYFIFSTQKYEDNKYSEADLALYMELIKQHFYHDGIINCPYIEDNNIVDNLLLIPKTIVNI